MEVLKAFAEKNSITFPLLSDEGNQTIDAYGIRNTEMDGKKYGPNDLSGVPHPGTYIVGQDGTIEAKLFLKKYQERHSNEELIEAIKALK